jgi:hypothetical protein
VPVSRIQNSAAAQTSARYPPARRAGNQPNASANQPDAWHSHAYENAQAGNRCFGPLSALRAHTNTPHKIY